MRKSRIRPMTTEDLDQVLESRNNPKVRGFMFTMHEISLDEHRDWFEMSNQDPNKYLLIYEIDRVPVGFLNICKTQNPLIADWGFYVYPDAPKGTGNSLGTEALSFAFNELMLHKLCGQALDFNDRSINFHKRLGFTEEGRLREQYFDGTKFHDILCFGLLSSEWQALVMD